MPRTYDKPLTRLILKCIFLLLFNIKLNSVTAEKKLKVWNFFSESISSNHNLIKRTQRYQRIRDFLDYLTTFREGDHCTVYHKPIYGCDDNDPKWRYDTTKHECLRCTDCNCIVTKNDFPSKNDCERVCRSHILLRFNPLWEIYSNARDIYGNLWSPDPEDCIVYYMSKENEQSLGSDFRVYMKNGILKNKFKFEPAVMEWDLKVTPNITKRIFETCQSHKLVALDFTGNDRFEMQTEDKHDKKFYPELEYKDMLLTKYLEEINEAVAPEGIIGVNQNDARFSLRLPLNSAFGQSLFFYWYSSTAKADLSECKDCNPVEKRVYFGIKKLIQKKSGFMSPQWMKKKKKKKK